MNRAYMYEFDCCLQYSVTIPISFAVVEIY